MPRTIREFTRSIIELLESQNIRYAIGGSVASSAYGKYRLTNDVDISVVLEKEQFEPLVKAIEALGYYVTWDSILDAMIWHTPFNVIDAKSNLKVDFFLVEPTPLEQSILARARRVMLDESNQTSAMLYSPEDVIIYKLKYFKEGQMPKHPSDILAMLEAREDKLDLDYIAAWAEQSGTLEIWNEILEEHQERLSKNK